MGRDPDVGPGGKDDRVGGGCADEGPGGRGGDGDPGCLQEAPSTEGGRHLNLSVSGSGQVQGVTAVKELSARKVSVFWRTHTQRVDVVAQVAERAGAAVAEGVAVGVGEAGHDGGSGALLDGGGAGGAHRVDVAEAVGADGGVPVGVVDRTQPPGGVRGRGDTAGDRLLYGFDSLA